MKEDLNKSKDQLINELDDVRREVARLKIFDMLATEMGQAVPDVIVFMDEDGNHMNVVTGQKDLLLNIPNEGPILSIFDIMPKETAILQLTAIKKALKTNKTQIIEYSLNVIAGEKWFEGRISPLPPRENHKRELIMISRDISKRRKAEENLKLSESKYRTVVENIPERIVLRDRNHIIVSCNNLFASFLNKIPEELTGTHPEELYPAELAKKIMSTNEHVMTTGELTTLTDTTNRNGHEIINESTIIPVRDDKKNITGTLGILRDITELKRTEDTLRFFDAALKSIRESIYAMDTDFKVTYWNHSCEETFGIKASEAIGKHIGELLEMQEEYPGQNQERLDLLIGQGYNREEQVYITPRGKVWVDVYAQAIEQNGEQHGWITLANDISERKRVEENLRLSEERFSKAFRSVPSSIIISRLHDGMHIEVNDSFTKLIGYSREESIGKTARELGVWADMNDRVKVISILEQEGKVENYEFEFRKKSGEIGIGLITVEPININGVPCIISVITDITERKKSEEQVRYQASLVDNVTDVIISYDDNYRVLSWNKAAERVYGYKAGDVLGEDIRGLWEIEPLNISMEETDELVMKTGQWKGEAIHHLKNGTDIYVRISVMLVRDNIKNNMTFVIIMSDITEEKKAERELKKHYERELALRQELETEMKKRTEFSAAIVHELKTPLTAIISSSELLMETAQEGPQKRLAKNINLSSYELDKRTGELLDMTRGEVGILEIVRKPVDFLALIDSMSLNFKAILSRKNMAFNLELPLSLPIISADESRLKQVIHNLIDNANKYSDEGGTVTLKVKENKTDIVVEIRDTGPGLTDKEKEYVFEPYRQLMDGKRAKGGMGLGLAISRNLITAHGGKIWVESRKGKGSSFFFSLPLNHLKEKERS